MRSRRFIFNLTNLHPNFLPNAINSQKVADEIALLFQECNGAGVKYVGPSIEYNQNFRIHKGKILYHFDINSAYAYAILNVNIPIGPPQLITGTVAAEIDWKGTIGFANCCVEVTKRLPAVITVKAFEGTTLNATGLVPSLTLPIPELVYLEKINWLKILKVNKVLAFPYQRKLFNPFIKELYQERLTARPYTAFFKKQKLTTVYGNFNPRPRVASPLVLKFPKKYATPFWTDLFIRGALQCATMEELGA